MGIRKSQRRKNINLYYKLYKVAIHFFGGKVVNILVKNDVLREEGIEV